MLFRSLAADLDRLNPDQQARLVPHLGTPVCGLAQAMGMTALVAGSYHPSVPFISLQAAALAVGRLIAQHAGCNGLPNFAQYDGLLGPQLATLEDMRVNRECYCQTNASTIEAVRELRRG